MSQYSVTYTHSAEDILKPISDTRALYNMRTQEFGTEYKKITVCSKPIFNPHKLERMDKSPRVSYKQDKDSPISDSSIKRAIDKVFQIAYANNFDYFITLTLDESKISRSDVDEIKHKLNIWLDNKVRRNEFKYILVPEYHADGQSIHFHGLCSGQLSLIDSGTVHVAGHKKPMKREKAKRLGLEGTTIFNLDNWTYGFSTVLELSGNRGAVSNYVCKYITKDSKKILGRFYLSGGKGLIRSVPTTYDNTDFSKFDAGYQVSLPDFGIAFKYRTEKEGE